MVIYYRSRKLKEMGVRRCVVIISFLCFEMSISIISVLFFVIRNLFVCFLFLRFYDLEFYLWKCYDLPFWGFCGGVFIVVNFLTIF